MLSVNRVLNTIRGSPSNIRQNGDDSGNNVNSLVLAQEAFIVSRLPYFQPGDYAFRGPVTPSQTVKVLVLGHGS